MGAWHYTFVTILIRPSQPVRPQRKHHNGAPVIEQACCRWVLLAALGENFRKIALSTASKGLIWRENLALLCP
jgi:hypothetical protein